MDKGVKGTYSLPAHGFSLVLTEERQVRVARTPLSRRRVLQQGLHGREIKALAYSPVMGVLATGAEDTVVRLSTVNENTGEVAALAVVKRHTTGVQHLVWSACGRWLFSSGGVEEFFVWRVRKSDNELGVVEEAKCEVGEEGGDLRICGFDVVGIHEEKTDEVIGFVIGMVYSDSSVKVAIHIPSQVGEGADTLLDRFTTTASPLKHSPSSSPVPIKPVVSFMLTSLFSPPLLPQPAVSSFSSQPLTASSLHTSSPTSSPTTNSAPRTADTSLSPR